MICLGNICRSPMAEGILRSKLPKNFTVASAGTSNYHDNQKPDKRAIEVCSKHGIDISTTKGRQFKPSDFNDFDLIYVMDHANYSDITYQAKNKVDKDKVRIITEEDPENSLDHISDPYYGEIEDFEKTYQQLDRICSAIAEKVTEKSQSEQG